MECPGVSKDVPLTAPCAGRPRGGQRWPQQSARCGCGRMRTESSASASLAGTSNDKNS